MQPKENNAMEATKRLHPLLTAAAISVTVFSAVGVAALTGLLPHSSGSSKEAPASVAAPVPETAIANAVAHPVDSMPAALPAPVSKPKPKRLARASAPPVAQAPQPVEAPAPVVRPGLLGTVDAVREIEQPGDAKGGGAVAGGVAGAVLGHNIGDHNKLVTVLGAAGGALLGNHIEKQARATKRWEISVRFDNGTMQTISSDAEPFWHAGDRVRWLDGKLQPV
jgi:outer membrane lipoprotein SlyB